MESNCKCQKAAGFASLLAVYHKQEQRFSYHQDLIAYLGQGLRGQLLWDYLAQTEYLTNEESAQMQSICQQLNDEHSLFYGVCSLKEKGTHSVNFAYYAGAVTITFQPHVSKYSAAEVGACDELTGLLGRNAFCKELERLISENPARRYAVFFFDVVRFKAINDFFGFSEGDKLLMHIADKLKTASPMILSACRESADRFSFLADVSTQTPDKIMGDVLREIESYKLSFEINCNVGVYLVEEPTENGNSMLDKAMLAQSAIKGNYTRKIHYFTQTLRDEMLSEQEIAGSMNTALTDRQFVLHYQPQYDHSTGMLIGAEALVRWQHPEKGLISPAVFIPIFEKNGFISKLDFYVFEHACQFLRSALDRHYAMVPISINFSKNDIYSLDFVENLERLRLKYDVPARYLRIEVTESVLLGNPNFVNSVFKKLHDCGYIIEMDDFGSGYSSLNVLKELEFDIIKLDMLFLSGENSNHRGGTILTSVVNMAKWLNLSIIAEGVETVSQADFLRSIGCNYVQGYLYSKPLPQADYEKLISASQIGTMIPQMTVIDTMNFANFWDPSAQETLIFNNYVGSAAIFRYNRATEQTEILRVNKKYLQELGMNLSEQEIIQGNADTIILDEEKATYIATLNNAIDTMEEQECETWQRIKSPCCGEEVICVRSSVRVIGSSGDQYLFYAMIRNVTAEKQHYQSMLDREKRFKMAIEQVNVYFWEYTIATREMRPCFRCMRDLKLPPLLRNYPESGFELGIFPPEVHDMYCDWHVQIANGVKELEAIIPLTMDRIPFRVRYTTEFDKNGHPVKAYGSAALIVDGQ